jgi:hypothetical protein
VFSGLGQIRLCYTLGAVLLAVIYVNHISKNVLINSLTPELNPSAQHCLTRSFYGDFAF